MKVSQLAPLQTSSARWARLQVDGRVFVSVGCVTWRGRDYSDYYTSADLTAGRQHAQAETKVHRKYC